MWLELGGNEGIGENSSRRNSTDSDWEHVCFLSEEG